MHSVWLGEFMGTMILIYLGTSVGAGVTLRKSFAADAGNRKDSKILRVAEMPPRLSNRLDLRLGG